MKSSFLFIASLCLCFTIISNSYAQSESEVSKSQSGEKQVMSADLSPKYIGGTESLMNYLLENINYPDEAKEQKVEGIVYVKFKITEEGTVEDVKVVKGIGYGCDEEAKRVVNGMGKWEPAKRKGKAVITQLTLPINFTLMSSKPLQDDDSVMKKDSKKSDKKLK